MENTTILFSILILSGLVGVGLLFTLIETGLNRKKEHSWQKLATATRLTYTPAEKFAAGPYRGYRLELQTVEAKDRRLFTRIVLATDRPAATRLVQAETVLTVETLYPLRLVTGEHLKVTPEQYLVDYKRPGLMTNMAYLESMFAALSDVADVFCLVLVLEEKAIPVLQKAITAYRFTEPGLCAISLRLLDIITRTISGRLEAADLKQFCPGCLATYTTHQVQIAPLTSYTYLGCRVCGSSTGYFEIAKIIVALDREMEAIQKKHNEVLWINGLARPALCDFDEVRIIRAADEEIEQFARRVEADTDPIRTARYRQIPVFIAPACQVSAPTRRLLDSAFGPVQVRDTERLPV